MKTIPSRSFTILFVVSLSFSSLAIFTVKAQEELPTLKIQLISPINKTYGQNTILLNFSIQKQPYDNMKYTIGYTMQGENTQKQGTFYMGTLSQNEMSFNKNFTDLQDGTCTITVSGKYVDRIIWAYSDKQTVTFTIDTKTSTPSPTPTSTPTPEPELPTVTVIASIAVVLVGFGIFAYLVKKRTTK